MCRWIAYSGGPIPLEEIVVNAEMSLIDQSLLARRAHEPTNGDGFGIGWFGAQSDPGRYRSTKPSWDDANLLDLARYIHSPMFVAHVRRATGTPIQQSNCHPFRYGRWLFAHNGQIEGFREVKRELALSVNPDLYPEIGGSTDSELMFFLALTFGLETNPVRSLEIMAGLVEEVCAAHGISNPLQMTMCLTDGERVHAIRYSSNKQSRSLYYSASFRAMQELHPYHAGMEDFPENARAVVSEPLTTLSGLWVKVPESSALEIRNGEARISPFRPQAP